MNKRLLLPLLCITLAPRASQAQAQNVPMAITWDYYAETKTLLLHATNNSGKDIVAYYISIRHKLPEGTWDKQSLSGRTMDSVSTLVSIQMSKDPAAYERRLQESGLSLLMAGKTHDITCYGVNSSDVEVAADVVFYADGSFDKQDETAFKRMVARRQGQLLEMKKANKIMRDALADTTKEHPTATAIGELAKAAAEAMAHNPDGPYDTESEQVPLLQGDIQNMRNMQRLPPVPSQHGKIERERLTQYVEDREKQIELMTPHCHLEIVLK
jgi:hypothetical protein